FDIAPGDTLGLVGESGCGKTMTCLAPMGLLDRGASLEAGAIRLRGETVAAARRRDAARALSRRAGMIFQNPHTCLNPVRTVGWQVAEAYRLRAGGPRAEADRLAAALLDRVGIPDAARRARDYPHQLSGGMNQRVMIAMAIAGAPDLLVADEPTTALDVTVQAQIIELMRELQQELGMAILFVTHDLGLISEIADR
ncbi:MAG: ABC transporter ATP-binding protein, partial [Alphaproteobacteria bacterium]